ncbi:MAG: cobyrinate a,c-diamide synthase [Sulfuricellaceae bacterium]|nr:cobyrinate a,c-diamide synthase [Sulfuricellaceae bacterium]
MARVLISAAHKSSGKTTISIGLCAALNKRGLVVQSFKKGPDYIDPMWLSAATGHSCHNLDFYLMTPDEIQSNFISHSAGADICLIEGNKGLYDGLDLDGSNSNAALAKLLKAPVVLVIDARGMTRGIAPLILGYQAFDSEIQIAGVILNNLGGGRHEAKLRAVIEHYTDVPVLGAVHHDPRLQITERHLGLMPSNEAQQAAQHVSMIGDIIASSVDLDRFIQVAESAPDRKLVLPTFPTENSDPQGYGQKRLRIGIARDRAFGFYYADDLEAMALAGADIVPFNTLTDSSLPEAIDGVFIGGGFPELFMRELEANSQLRHELNARIEQGLPVYAECGGLMYLARTMAYRGEKYNMVGTIPGDVEMHDKPVGRGYVKVRTTGDGIWPEETQGKELSAHEFHYSSLENLPCDLKYAYEVIRGHGIDGRHDGIVYKNLLACYTHFRSLKGYNWARRFVEFVREVKLQAKQTGVAK